jgi:hypothetical protein
MGLSILDVILDMQLQFYQKYNMAVSLLFINSEKYRFLTKELEAPNLDNLHGMKIIITKKTNIEML